MSFNPAEYLRSEWMKAEDLPQDGQVFTIADAYEHFFERDKQNKPVLQFSETQQKLTLNKTRLRTMCELHSGNPAIWTGQRVHLTTAPTAMGATIVINAAPAAVEQPQPPTINGTPAQSPAQPLTDGDIPF